MNAIDTLASGPGPGGQLHIGFILLALIVLGALGFGAVRLSGRRRARGLGRTGGQDEGWAGAPAPGGVASAQPVRDNLPARPALQERAAPPRAARAVVSPGAGGWAVETHGLTKRFGANVAVGLAMDQLRPAGLAGGGAGGPGHVLFGGRGALEIPPMPTWAMIAVIVGWIVGWSVIGAWRMMTRDA